MVDEKLIRLIARLSTKTLAGEIDWEETSDEDTFSASFPNYSVQLSVEDKESTDGKTTFNIYVFKIIDSDGRTIEEVNDMDFEEEDFGMDAEDVMRQMYNEARRNAIGVHDALDSILAELEE